MKLLIILSLIFTFATAFASKSNLKGRDSGKFSTYFAQALGEINKPDDVYFLPDDLTEINSKLLCIQNKINFEQNKDKIIEESTFFSLFMGACGLCIGNQAKFWSNSVERLLSLANSDNFPDIDKPECLELEFRKFQPNSPLLRNFDDSAAHDAAIICEGDNAISEFKNGIRDYDRDFGGFSELTCGALNDRKALELVLNIGLMAFEKDQAVVNSEIQRIGNELRIQAIRMVDCIKQNLNFD